MDISRNTFDASKGYERVTWQAQAALLDFDFNEAQDILRDSRDRLAATLFDGLKLLGSSGNVTPSTTARAVDITGGVAFSGSTVVRLPGVVGFAAFSGGATGAQTATIYVDWYDASITAATDPNIEDVAFGEATRRLQRVVIVAVVAGTALPTPASGHTLFKLATITHNFTSGGNVLIASDIVMEPTALSGGELAGYGAPRTMVLRSNALAASDGFIFDTRQTLSGVLLRLRNAGTDKLVLMADGKLGLGKSPTEMLDLVGNVKATGDATIGGNIIVAGTVDGVELSSHTHDGTTAGGGKVAHSNLLGLGNDDHTQYVHNTVARTITAVHTFNPASAGAPFILAANATGRKVVGLNADQLDGFDSADFASVAATEAITGSWTFNADVLLGTNIKVGGINLGSVKDSGTGIGHNKLSGLTADDHAQYVHLSVARTITGVHTFNPAATGAPFIIGAHAVGQLVAGLNADYVGGKQLSDLDNRYLRLSGDTMTGTIASIMAAASQVLTTARTGDTKPRFVVLEDGTHSWSAGGNTNPDVTLRRISAGLVGTDNSFGVAVDLTVAGRARAVGNLLDLSGSPVSQGITASGFVPVPAVGKRALVTYFRIVPASYSGTYDVKVFADNNTGAELLAQWTTQQGELFDRVPWYFSNARSDENLYVQIVKNSNTGSSDSFAVSLRVERFA